VAGIGLAAFAFFRQMRSRPSAAAAATTYATDSAAVAGPATAAAATAAATAAASAAPAAPREIKAILFDMDGTLLESAEIWFQLLRDACAHFGYPELQYDDWHSTFGQSMAKNVERFMPGADRAAVDRFCVDNYGRYLDKMFVLPGAEEALEFANSVTGGRTIIVTNCPQPITDQILSAPKAARIADLLRRPDGSLRVVAADDLVTVAGETVPRPAAPKPSPELVFEAARVLGVAAEHCMLVGDSVYDVGAIRNAGGVAVGIKARGGEYVVDAVAEIATITEGVVYNRE
jgi:beta-phosphoglucomutase-like phosphatase (HAD superfamily)